MLELILEVSVAEFEIRLQYTSKQHTGAENAFLLRIFDWYAAKTWIFSYATRIESGRGKMEFMPTPRFGPNGASVKLASISWFTYRFCNG